MKKAISSLLALSAALSATAMAGDSSLQLVPGRIRTCTTAREARESFSPALQLSRPAFQVRGTELEVSVQLQYVLCKATGESTAAWSAVLPESTLTYELPDGTRATVRNEQNRLAALPWNGKVELLAEVAIANSASQRLSVRAKLSDVLSADQLAAYESGKTVTASVELFGKSLTVMSAPTWTREEARENFTGSYVLSVQLKK